MDKKNSETIPCCKPFCPVKFQDKEIIWNDKLFIKESISCFFHVPFNLGRIFRKHQNKIINTDDENEYTLFLTEERSLFGADMYIEASGPVKGSENVTLSGKFHTKVFEGPNRNIHRWKNKFKRELKKRGISVGKLYYYIPMCSKCSKKYKKSYAVIFAKEV